ncbi:hypothetical protein FDI61_gp032 [Mycobacterium phage Marvin]|uniref:Uncharacterized protein n=3 Tax=Marvinvirus TaxID=1982091 RepID=G1BNA2_9CAUD|nr:hypothetical protein FH33_gp032 [Mycobacterium phage MosMoris]YP_009614150.1 hypothetical protein FDI61_gp032 [Mycobacterium phage Marvin]AEJ95316.1 hypothetical protein MARVIN_32 [Mycobacterium phage Marvin]AHY84106.1 hypothetical protein PBI_MOSMORIS_32 [Mycobacterium phage MosMoris]ANM46256.1 hypothetical protein SEA_GATTACA_33 [Mycobacterium phage Gattaca]
MDRELRAAYRRLDEAIAEVARLEDLPPGFHLNAWVVVVEGIQFNEEGDTTGSVTASLVPPSSTPSAITGLLTEGLSDRLKRSTVE